MPSKKKRTLLFNRVALMVTVMFIVVQLMVVHQYSFPSSSIDTDVISFMTETNNKQQIVLRSEFQRRQQQEEQFEASSIQTQVRAPDAYLNGIPLHLHQGSSDTTTNGLSTIHCVGETPFEQTSWMSRSCQYRYLCLDPTSNEFFVVNRQSLPRRGSLRRMLTNSTTSAWPPAVALGGINPRWNGTNFNQGIDKVKWSPSIRSQLPSSYYVLDHNVVLVPFHSFAGHNVGHLLWDDFLPIFTLLQTFGFIDYDDNRNMKERYQIVLIRVDTLSLLYASCEIRRNKRQGCQDNFQKFLPLMGIHPDTFSTLKNIQLTNVNNVSLISNGQNSVNNYLSSTNSPLPICARHAAAGMGMLTDHGWEDHGWEPKLTDKVHNIGRGPQLYQFRNFMLRNMGLPTTKSPSTKQQYHILLNTHSSRDSERDKGLEKQYQAIQNAFPTTKVSLLQLKEHSLQEQLELVSQETNIIISVCGGGTITAYFLPRGSSLILYYADRSGFNFDKFALTGGPALLDWDLFNNLGYVQVHWLPISKMDTAEGLDDLIAIIQEEMAIAASTISSD